MDITPALRSVWLAIILIVAVLVGTAGGLLSWLGGVHPALAVVAGGGTFVAAATFLLSLFKFATDRAGNADRA